MLRRSFLKSLAGLFGAGLAAPVLALVPEPTPVSQFEAAIRDMGDNWYDPIGKHEAFAKLGEELGGQIRDRLAEEGFARRVLKVSPIL